MTFACQSRSTRSIFASLLGLALVLAVLPAQAQDREQKDPYLTEEDINLIRVYEVDLESDPPPTIKIPRDELRKFLKQYQSDDRIPRGRQAQDRWLRSDGAKQLELLFKLKARDYYQHVRISSKIDSLRAFRNIHRQYVLEYLQPNFGAGQIPELFLFPRGRDTERIEMTNFYILTQTSIGGVPLIDRNVPEESLMLQWGLPRQEAKFPAPEELENWEPKFKDTKDERFVEYVDWIKSLIRANQGSDMGISYQPPKHKKPNSQ